MNYYLSHHKLNKVIREKKEEKINKICGNTKYLIPK